MPLTIPLGLQLVHVRHYAPRHTLTPAQAPAPTPPPSLPTPPGIGSCVRLRSKWWWQAVEMSPVSAGLSIKAGRGNRIHLVDENYSRLILLGQPKHVTHHPRTLPQHPGVVVRMARMCGDTQTILRTTANRQSSDMHHIR